MFGGPRFAYRLNAHGLHSNQAAARQPQLGDSYFSACAQINVSSAMVESRHTHTQSCPMDKERSLQLCTRSILLNRLAALRAANAMQREVYFTEMIERQKRHRRRHHWRMSGEPRDVERNGNRFAASKWHRKQEAKHVLSARAKHRRILREHNGLVSSAIVVARVCLFALPRNCSMKQQSIALATLAGRLLLPAIVCSEIGRAAN